MSGILSPARIDKYFGERLAQHFVADTVLKCFLHTEKYGDTRFVTDLFVPAPRGPIARQLFELTEWFHEFSPIRVSWNVSPPWGSPILIPKKSPEYRPFRTELAIAAISRFAIDGITLTGDLGAGREIRKSLDVIRKYSAAPAVAVSTIVEVMSPTLISCLPDVSHPDLLALYRVCPAALANASSRLRALQLLHVAIIAEWKRRHDALAAGATFPWPSIDAPTGEGWLSDAHLWPSAGMLRALGYHVGTTAGRSIEIRRFILDELFTITLPPMVCAEYMRDWGASRTETRLSKASNTLAALIRNAKRRNFKPIAPAISDWEADLNYLHSKFYVGYFGFPWPTL